MTTKLNEDARVGDLVEIRGLHGQPARCGEIVELLGGAGHARYRVRWDAEHESIVYPSDGVSVVHGKKSDGSSP
jgi:Domain of unknown function (DUF1918)